MWVDNIKMDLREIVLGRIDWIDSAQERAPWRALVNTVINLQVSCNAWKFSRSCKTSGLSRGI
jgi:hypothetical protein